MKKHYYLVIMLWVFTGGMFRVQGQSNDSLRLGLNHIFTNIDKSQIYAGRLAEYAIPLVSLTPFNGTLTDSSLTNINAFRLLYATIGSARISGIEALPNLNEVNTRLAAQSTTGAISIATLFTEYVSLKPNAISSNLMRVQDNQLYDVAGRTSTPYNYKELFAAAPARSYSESGHVSFVFPSSLYLQSMLSSSSASYPLRMSGISIDFGDGRGYVSASFNTPIATDYSTAGVKRIKVRITYYTKSSTSTSARESHFDLEVRNPACTNCLYAAPGRIVTFPATATHSGGTIHIRYGGNHTQLVKPLIVAEGYDVSKIAPGLQTNFGIGDFLRLINTPNFSLQDNLDFGTNANYDIVFIDYVDGTDDIRRNAALFEEVVEWVNTNRVGSTRNVVMGISMGGLVARYGLAEMVKTNRDPQTRLLITHDTPHRGANTPLGLQALTRQANATVLGSISGATIFGRTLIPEVGQANDLLDAPATQQLLLLRATNGSGGVATNTFLDGEYRNMITFSSGQIAPYRLITTSLGSQCGNGNGLLPYDELVRSNASGFLSPLPWISKNKIKTEIVVNALPSAGSSRRLSSLRVYATYKILSFISVTYTIHRATYNSPSNQLALDGLPGGTQNVSTQAGSSLPTGEFRILWFLGGGASTTLAQDFCFVSTASALDVAELSTSTTSAVYVGGTSSGLPPRVDNFIAQERFTRPSGQSAFNRSHPQFSARNGEWLFNEIQQTANNTLNCSSECTPYGPLNISGPADFCGTATFTAPLIRDATYSWSVSPANLLSPAAGSSNTFSATASQAGSGQVSVTITSPCLTTTLQQPINTCAAACPGGSSTLSLTANQIGSSECGDVYRLVANGTNLGPNYAWSFNGVVDPAYDGQSFIDVYIDNFTPSMTVAVSVSSTCAGGGSPAASQFISGNYPGCDQNIMVFPNPSDSEVQIAFKAPELPTSPNGKKVKYDAPKGFKAELYDGRGKKVSSKATETDEMRLSTTELPEGLYHLTVTRGTGVIQRNLSVKH